MDCWEPHESDLRTDCAATAIGMAFDVKPPFEKTRALQTPVVDPANGTNTLLDKVLEALNLRQLTSPDNHDNRGNGFDRDRG